MNDHLQQDPAEQALRTLEKDSNLSDLFRDSRLEGRAVDIDALLEHQANLSPASQWSRSDKRIPRTWVLAVALLIFAVVGLAPFWAGRNGETAASVLGQMQDQLDQVRSVQYTEIETFPDEQDSDPIERRHFILGKHLVRVEQGKPLNSVGRALDLLREWAGLKTAPLHAITINNARTGKHVTLFPNEKRFVVLTHQVLTDTEGNLISKEEIEPNVEVDFYERIRSIPADATIDLGDGMINGRHVIGLGVVKPWDHWHRTEEYWVDADSKLPVWIEIRLKPLDPERTPRLGSQTWVLKNFKFDQVLDEALFGTDPPVGYKVESDSIYGVQLDSNEDPSN